MVHNSFPFIPIILKLHTVTDSPRVKDGLVFGQKLGKFELVSMEGICPVRTVQLQVLGFLTGIDF